MVCLFQTNLHDVVTVQSDGVSVSNEPDVVTVRSDGVSISNEPDVVTVQSDCVSEPDAMPVTAHPNGESAAGTTITSSELPLWAKPLKNTYCSEGFVHGFVDATQLEVVLEMHCRACLLDHVRR